MGGGRRPRRAHWGARRFRRIRASRGGVATEAWAASRAAGRRCRRSYSRRSGSGRGRAARRWRDRWRRRWRRCRSCRRPASRRGSRRAGAEPGGRAPIQPISRSREAGGEHIAEQQGAHQARHRRRAGRVARVAGQVGVERDLVAVEPGHRVAVAAEEAGQPRRPADPGEQQVGGAVVADLDDRRAQSCSTEKLPRAPDWLRRSGEWSSRSAPVKAICVAQPKRAGARPRRGSRRRAAA